MCVLPLSPKTFSNVNFSAPATYCSAAWFAAVSVLFLCFFLNFVLTSLSQRFLGRLYAIKGGSANILDKRSFDFKNP